MNMAWGSVVTFLTAVLGDYWFLFLAFFLLNVADYVTGWLKAYFAQQENSNKGLKGIVKKVGYWVVIAIAFFTALAFTRMGAVIGINLDFLTLIGWFTLATFIMNEIRSILENLVIIGVDVPAFLIKGLEVAAGAIEEKTNKRDGEK